MSIIECYCCTNKHKPYVNGTLKNWIPSSSVGLCKRCRPIKSLRGVQYDHYPINKDGIFKKKIKRVIVPKRKRREIRMTQVEVNAYRRGYRKGIRFALDNAKIILPK